MPPHLDGPHTEAVTGSQHVAETEHQYRREVSSYLLPATVLYSKDVRPIPVGPAVPFLPDSGFGPTPRTDAAMVAMPVRSAYQARAVSPARVAGNLSG